MSYNIKCVANIHAEVHMNKSHAEWLMGLMQNSFDPENETAEIAQFREEMFYLAKDVYERYQVLEGK